jgi:general secretion pathway protein G
VGSPKRRVSSSATKGQQGFTLLELTIALAIVALLAALAAPSLASFQRHGRERELREDLRSVRTALDQFHDDWVVGRITRNDDCSPDGWPVTLEVLVQGVPESGPAGHLRWYLRRLPVDPMDLEGKGWSLRGYQNKPDDTVWNGKDVYDLRSASHEESSDGTPYGQW